MASEAVPPSAYDLTEVVSMSQGIGSDLRDDKVNRVRMRAGVRVRLRVRVGVRVRVSKA